MLLKIFNDRLKDLTKPGMFRSFPVCEDRKTWESIAPELKHHIIREAEGLIGFHWPRMKMTDYLQYYREGSRKRYDGIFKLNFDALTKLTMGECVENKGRFLDDIANGIIARCEETAWVHAGHLNQYGDENIPRYDTGYLDLRACSTASQLAHVYYLLKSKLDEVSPQLCKRIEYEIKRRILDNYLNNDYWWMNLSNEGTVNNWNTHCNKNIIYTAMIMEKDSTRLKELMGKACRSLDKFLSIHADDGACNEGPGYWKGAGFSYLTILTFIADTYRFPVSEFLDSRIRNMGSYIYKVFIHKDYYMSYADGDGKNPMSDIKLYRTALAIDDETLLEMASDLFGRHRSKNQYYKQFIFILHDYLEYTMGYSDIKSSSEKGMAKKYYQKEAILKNAHIAAARQFYGDCRGFFAGIKGGHNGESHNHNDIGVFYLYFDGLPVVIDAGSGVYTINTFSQKRYDIWTMQSKWHSLPVINGCSQYVGSSFKSINFKYETGSERFRASIDIAQAYPKKAGIEKYRRTIQLDRDKSDVILEDFIKMEESTKDILWYMTIAFKPIISGTGIVILNNGITRINLDYDSESFLVEVEKKNIEDDTKLKASWGKEIYRLYFKTLKVNREHRIKLTFTVTGGIDEQ